MATKASDVCESGQSDDCEAFLEIERSRIPLRQKVLQCLARCLPRITPWQLLCFYVIVLSVSSFGLVTYLKLTGEMIPFCLYDNWYYLVYYLAMSFFMAVLIPLNDFDVISPENPFWRWARRLGAYSWFVEWEGLLYMAVYAKSIRYEIEYDDEAQLLVGSLALLGAVRFGTVSVGYWNACKTLERIRQRKKLSADHFGNTMTDLLDIVVVHLIWMSVMAYKVNVYNIVFLSTITYIYVAFARN